MSSFEFCIPLQKDELLEAHAGSYHVEDVYPPRILLSKLQDVARAYNTEGIEYMLEHFDTYFSIIIHGTKLEWNVINKGFDHLTRTVKNLCSHLEVILQDQTINVDVRVKNLNIVKMTMYLFTQMMAVKDAKLAADNSGKLTLGKKGKKAVQDEDCEWTEADKQAALICIHLILQQQLPHLWDPPLPDDNFVTMMAVPCYKALEEQIIKNKSVRDTVFQILGVLIKKYNHGSSCVIRLVKLLQNCEHSVAPICAGVVQLTKEFGLSTFGREMVREITETLATSDEVNEGGGNEQASKNCGTFLNDLTKELPKEMVGAIVTIQPYLETDESYTIRNSVLGMMCSVLCVELTGEELTDEQRVQRDDFLDDLFAHMHDKSAYVRHKVLQFWGKLQRERCVPVIRQHAVLERGIGRLRDKAALVRKAAIQLVKIFLECNPFSAQLKIDELEKQLVTEQKILEGLVKQLNPDPDPELIKSWESIEDDVKQTIKEKMDILTQDEPELSQATLNSLYQGMRKHLRKKDYFKACLVIKHLERLYPEAKIINRELRDGDQVEYYLALLRKIYILPDRRESITEQCENELAISKRIEEKESIVAFLQESLQFCHLIAQAIPLINNLLMSKQTGDVHEAIDFFTCAHHFNIKSASTGVANMLLLVWSKDQDKREAVERAYRDMYIECDIKAERARAFTIARKLLTLISEVDRGRAFALEHLVDKWITKGDITPSIIQVFWEIFLKKIDGTTESDSYAALSFLVMISKAKSSVAAANLELLQTHGFTGDYRTRALCAQMILSLAGKGQRYPANHPIFTCLCNSIMETYTTLIEFNNFTSNCLEFIYGVCDTPEIIAADLLAKAYHHLDTMKVMKDDGEEAEYSTELMTRFIFMLGYVAMQQLIYLDISVYSELRRRNQVREDRKAEEKRKKKAGIFATPGKRPLDSSNVNSSASSRRNRSASVVANKTSSTNTTMTEDEAGLEGAVADDADAEYVRGVCERDIVYGDAQLARYQPLIRELLLHPGRYSAALETATAVTLTRYMWVSSAVCEESLQLMLTVLKKSKNVSLRTSLTIAFADLTLRFPNLTQPWTQHIYHILADEELDVRECAVKMLSFLVLHEMIRVKGQIADMALCCADKNPRVADMTKLFFKQLSQKGNALYNVMPDIISRLSDPELNVAEDQYRLIMKYIVSLIQKDRQMEALIEKLCQRFKLSTEERQWRDLAYCLSLFTYNERSLRKLMENIDCYKDKLHCKGVMDCFNTLMNNASKMAKNDLKTLVTELGDKIEECFAVNDEACNENGDKETESQPVGRATPRATPRRRAAPRRNKRRSSSSADEDEPPNTPIATPRSTRTTRKVVQKGKTYDTDESEDDDFQKKEDVFKKPSTRKVIRKRHF